MIPMSQRLRPGLTILPRPALPMDRYGSCPESKTCCSVGGLTKTVWSNQLSKVLAAFAIGSPIWSGRFPPALLLLKVRAGVRRFPLWKVAMPEICHPPRMKSTAREALPPKRFPWPNGSSKTLLTTSRWRISAGPGPLSNLNNYRLKVGRIGCD